MDHIIASEFIYTTAASLSSASILLGAGYKLFDSLLDRRLLEMEKSIFDRINGSYIRRSECALLHQQSISDYQYLRETALELKKGMDDIRDHLIDKRYNENL